MKTKHFLMVAMATMILSVPTFGQIKNIYLTKDSTLVIDRIYAGILSGTLFHTDSLYTTGFTGIRFGGMGSYSPAKWISFKSYAMYQADAGAASMSIQQFYVKLSPIKKLSLEFGSMATLPTEQRPHPVSGNGQFETWSESQIPGGTMNAKLKYQFTKSFQLATGIANRKGLPEYSGRITYKKIQLSGWYSKFDEKFGTAFTFDGDRVYSTFVFKQDQTIADILVIKLSKKQDISFYSDMGYDISKKDLVRGEWGFLKGFDSTWLNGLFGLGYRNEDNAIVGYWFVHL